MSEVQTDSKPSKTPITRKITKPRKLTPKQKLFVDKYTDITDKKTFGNGVQSALVAYNTESPVIASDIAMQTLQSPTVQTYIEQLNSQAGNSIEERSKQLALAMQGKLRSCTLTTNRGINGEVLGTSEVLRDIPPSQILRAIDLSNKVEGVYNRANVQEHVAKRAYDERMKELREAMHKRLQAHKVSASITSDE